jgi:hypothetical protein
MGEEPAESEANAAYLRAVLETPCYTEHVESIRRDDTRNDVMCSDSVGFQPRKRIL